MKAAVFDSAIEGFFMTHYDFFSPAQETNDLPPVTHLADLFAGADHAESAFFMEPEAGGILGKDPGLER